MSEVVQDTQQEFWRPPSPVADESDEIIVREAVPAMAETCPRCSSEFLLGSRFCHTCGGRRREAISPTARADAAVIARLWEQGVARMYSLVAGLTSRKTWSAVWSKIQFPAWPRYLHFHEIQSWIGLSTAALIAFMIGLGCVAGALLVGLLTAKTLVDWQAIQFYRVEWLLAATAAFVAGILLKKPSGRDGE
ncbi:MAG: hypothetical protein ACLPHP_03070 [Candidatus Sulfotelmatobacter sp.]